MTTIPPAGEMPRDMVDARNHLALSDRVVDRLVGVYRLLSAIERLVARGDELPPEWIGDLRAVLTEDERASLPAPLGDDTSTPPLRLLRASRPPRRPGTRQRPRPDLLEQARAWDALPRRERPTAKEMARLLKVSERTFYDYLRMTRES